MAQVMASVVTEAAAAQVLGRRQLFMLPTRNGLWFVLVLFAMLLAAINYNNGLAFGFTFLLASVVLVSMLYTHRNLSGIRVSVGTPQPVFAGQHSRFPVALQSNSDNKRTNVWVMCADETAQTDIESHQTAQVYVQVDAPKRGWLACPPVVVSSAFPFGLLYTWSRKLKPTARGLVYPEPGATRPLPLSPDRDGSTHAGTRFEGDDFSGLRDYRVGDSLRRVHWKAAARGLGMQSKIFSGANVSTLWLDWDMLPELKTEARLSQLCRWLLDAESTGCLYGLRLPGTEIAPSCGPSHRHECLRVLALWDIADV